MKITTFFKATASALSLGLVLSATSCSSSAKKAETVKDENTVEIGILHSLSGTMAISEVSLKDVLLMGIDEINAQGGVLGKKIVPKIVDPASDCPEIPHLKISVYCSPFQPGT